MFSQNKKNKKILLIALLISIIFVFCLINIVSAQGTAAGTPTKIETGTEPATKSWVSHFFDPVNWALGFATFMLKVVIYLFGQLLILVMYALVKVSSYNNFINVDFVTMGWTMLRDVVNMFFILGLLFIAFVTVLNLQKYQWNKLLFRLLLMAILVNFSRTILGLIIDAFQVIMLTFVNAYKNIGQQHLFEILGIQSYGKFNQTLLGATGDALTKAAQIVGSSALALIYILVSFVVVSIFLIILLFRIVALWILVVISPLAFFAWAFEGAGAGLGGISSQFWRKLWHYCSIGPALAFFLWLSLSAMVKFDAATQFGLATGPEGLTGTLSAAGTIDMFVKYLIGIMTLVGGLVVANQFQVIGASYAGSAVNWMKKQTAGRVENYARSAASKAKEYSAFGVKEGLQRVERAGGISGTLAKGARLLGTTQGRGILGERTKARMEQYLGGKPGALVEQRAKELKLYQDQYIKMGVAQNPEMMQRELKKATGDRRLALLNVLGDEGKMTKDEYQKSLVSGDFKHFGVKTKKDDKTGEIVVDFDKSDQGGLANLEALSKGWEKAYEKRTHLPISISPFVRNEITNQWERTGPGGEGENKRLKDAEDSLAKTRDIQLSLSAGDFANTDDLATNFTHLSGAGRNSYLRTAGKEAHEKFKKMLGENMIRFKGTPEEQRALAEEKAKKKGLEGADKERFISAHLASNKNFRDKLAANEREGKSTDDVKLLKNIQEGYQISTGEWEPGSGRGVKGGSNVDLAGEISGKQIRTQRKLYSEAKKNPALAPIIDKVDQIMPDSLQTFQNYPINQQITGIRKDLESRIGLEKSSKISDDLIKEYINNNKDIIDQQKVKTDLSGPITDALSKAAALAVKGGKKEDINSIAADLKSILTAGNFEADNAGMAKEYFRFDLIEQAIKNIESMAGKGAREQQDIIIDVTTALKTPGYYTKNLPTYKGKAKVETEEEEGPEEEPPTPSAPAPAKGRAAGRGAAPKPTPEAAPTTYVTNITNNLTQQTQNIVQATNDREIVQILRNTQEQLNAGLKNIRRELGEQFDETVANKLQSKVKDLITEYKFNQVLSANKEEVARALEEISKEMKNIKKTK